VEALDKMGDFEGLTMVHTLYLDFPLILQKTSQHDRNASNAQRSQASTPATLEEPAPSALAT
jgi:hypothetical protein